MVFIYPYLGPSLELEGLRALPGKETTETFELLLGTVTAYLRTSGDERVWGVSYRGGSYLAHE